MSYTCACACVLTPGRHDGVGMRDGTLMQGDDASIESNREFRLPWKIVVLWYSGRFYTSQECTIGLPFIFFCTSDIRLLFGVAVDGSTREDAVLLPFRSR